MRGDDPDDGVANLAATAERESFLSRGVVRWFGFVGHPQVGAQNVDAGLAVLLPVIGEACHCVYPSQPDRGLVVAELRGDRGEPLVEDAAAVVRCGGLGYPLPPVGHDQRNESACSGDRREHQLQNPDEVVQRNRRGVRQLRVLQ
jgi:hypothetical protein